MPNLYARATALSNVGGRIDYISNPRRQEHLLAVCDGAAELLDGQFWRLLAQESQTAFEQFGQKTRTVKDEKTGEVREEKLKCCQGREIVMALSNALFDRMKPEEAARILVDEFKEKLGLPVMVAIHDNKKECNKHAHVIFPERQLLPEPVIKVAERALFFDAQGKRRYKKSEILDENKQLLPGCKIVKKGEIYEQRYFSSADEKYRQRAWLKDVKTNVILQLRNGKLKGDVEITEYDPSSGKMKQQHVGNYEKSKDENVRRAAKRAEEHNRQVRIYNQNVDAGLVPAPLAKNLVDYFAIQEEKTAMLRRLNEFLQHWWILEQKARTAWRSTQSGVSFEERVAGAKIRSDKEVEKRMQTLNAPLNWRLQADLDRAMGTSFAAEDKARYFAKKREKEQEGR